MSQRFAAIVTAILIPAFATAAQTAVITKCGASKGYAYYFGGQAVPPGKAGWREDGISDGEIQLIQSGKELARSCDPLRLCSLSNVRRTLMCRTKAITQLGNFVTWPLSMTTGYSTKLVGWGPGPP